MFKDTTFAPEENTYIFISFYIHSISPSEAARISESCRYETEWAFQLQAEGKK